MHACNLEEAGIYQYAHCLLLQQHSVEGSASSLTGPVLFIVQLP